jgi:signal transduction histidine kinase
MGQHRQAYASSVSVRRWESRSAKHARASVVKVGIETEGANLLLSIRDDGIGGADAAKGSSLIGLTDWVEALGGT